MYSITMEDVFNGRSEARNRVVAHVFKELGLIEQWGSGINRILRACVEHGLQMPKIAEQNDFFDVEMIRPRPIATDYDRLSDDKQPEWQQELQQELKDLLEQGLEHEQQELQQELQQESLFTIVLSKMLHAPMSRKEISVKLVQKTISGQLNEILSKLQDSRLIEWTIPGTPNSSKQKYKLTKRGLAFYALIRKDGKK